MSQTTTEITSTMDELAPLRARVRDVSAELVPMRVRVAEVEARDAHCADEQENWERRRTAADTDGNERALAEADARLLALEQARRRNAATLGGLRASLADAEGRLLDARRAVADDDARQRGADARVALEDLVGIDGRIMTELRGRWLPEMDGVQAAITAAVDYERDADRLAGRQPRAIARTLDDLTRSVPGALWRLRILQAVARNEPVDPTPAPGGTRHPADSTSTILERLARGRAR